MIPQDKTITLQAYRSIHVLELMSLCEFSRDRWEQGGWTASPAWPVCVCDIRGPTSPPRALWDRRIRWFVTHFLHCRKAFRIGLFGHRLRVFWWTLNCWHVTCDHDAHHLRGFPGKRAPEASSVPGSAYSRRLPGRASWGHHCKRSFGCVLSPSGVAAEAPEGDHQERSAETSLKEPPMAMRSLLRPRRN